MDFALAFLPAGVGMNITFLAWIFVIGALIAIVGVGAANYSTTHPDTPDKHSLARFESHWTIIILIIFVVFGVSTLTLMPYPYAHSNVKPTMTVDVQASQFSWCLSNPPNWGSPNCVNNFQIPVGNTVLFLVNSSDVTHGFGVYDSQGTLLFQVQVMPGFVNSIMYQFTTPGTYYIRCREFCGWGHYIMISQFTVTNS